MWTFTPVVQLNAGPTSTGKAARTLEVDAAARTLTIVKPNGKRREARACDVLRLVIEKDAASAAAVSVLLRLRGAQTMEKVFSFVDSAERAKFIDSVHCARDGATASADADALGCVAARSGSREPWAALLPWSAQPPQLLPGETTDALPGVRLRVRCALLLGASWSSVGCASDAKEEAMHWAVHGAAQLTSFGLRFAALPSERARSPFAALAVAALAIARVVEDGDWIVLYCKDLRVVRFCCDAPSATRDALVAALRRLSLSSASDARELAFARAHCAAPKCDPPCVVCRCLVLRPVLVAGRGSSLGAAGGACPSASSIASTRKEASCCRWRQHFRRPSPRGSALVSICPR